MMPREDVTSLFVLTMALSLGIIIPWSGRDAEAADESISLETLWEKSVGDEWTSMESAVLHGNRLCIRGASALVFDAATGERKGAEVFQGTLGRSTSEGYLGIRARPIVKGASRDGMTTSVVTPVSP